MMVALGLAFHLLDFTSVEESANQPLIRSIRFTQVEPSVVRVRHPVD